MEVIEDLLLAESVIEAIRKGDVSTLRHILAEHPGLARARIAGDGGAMRTLLHVATDWPGHYPHVADTISALVAAGADVNARFIGSHSESALHWAASCDDVAALDALLDGGADIEAQGAVIDGGSPLNDAVAFGQWRAARRLVERGARTNLWHAAALGMLERVEDFFTGGNRPAPEEITQAFWLACHGGQRGTAEYLLAQGADPGWVGYDGLTPLGAAKRSKSYELAEWLEERLR